MKVTKYPSDPRNVNVPLLGQMLRKSEKAIQFQLIDKDSNPIPPAHWFPLSQISSATENYDELEGTFDILVLSEWILKQKNLLEIQRSQPKAQVYGDTPKPAQDMHESNAAAFFGGQNTTGIIVDDDIPF